MLLLLLQPTVIPASRSHVRVTATCINNVTSHLETRSVRSGLPIEDRHPAATIGRVHARQHPHRACQGFMATLMDQCMFRADAELILKFVMHVSCIF